MKLSELKEDFDWLKIIFDAHAKFMSEEGMAPVPRESYDIVLCKSIRALSDAIQQIEQLEEENAKLKRALQNIHKGPSAQAIDFTKSPELCTWVCDTIDMVADILTQEPE